MSVSKIRKLCPKIKIFSAVVVMFLVLGVFNQAQETIKSTSNTNQSTGSSPTPTPTSIPTPVPISDVTNQSDTTARRLEDIQKGLKMSPSVLVIESELPKLKDELDLRVTETTSLLSARPSLDTLSVIEQDWKALGKSVPIWKGDLTAQITALDTYVKELTDLKDLWEKTLADLKGSKAEADETSSPESNTNTEVAETKEVATEVPAEILQKITAIIGLIQETQKKVEASRGQLLTLQTQVSKQESRINETLRSITDVREEALSHLFFQDSPQIWNARRSTDSIGGIFSEARDSYTAQLNTLSEYASRKRVKFVIHALILLLFTGILFWARKRLRPIVEEEPDLKPAFSVFEFPIAGALILSIMLSGSLYPQAPRMLSAMLGAAALIPGIIYLRRILERPLFPILNALMVFYFVDLIKQITATLPLLSRILFTVELLGAIIFLIWFLRSKSLSDKIEVKHQRIFTTIRKALPFFIALFSIALIANIFGYVSLSNIVGNSVLGSSYIAIILYAVVQILKSLIIFAFRVRPLSTLGMVKTSREMLERKIFRGITWLGVLAWGILTLNLFSIKEAVFTSLKEGLTSRLEIGSIAISFGDVLIFCITVWLAFALSRLIRFILEEDVYPRVNLAGGVPYAISTMLHYVILVIGFILAIAALGLDLTKFTILAGAFGVGLGFGLQNIVNNFVSGLILLFERPVKVNDVVQIGTHQGDLKRIGLRASILRTLDGSEVIVPNSQLISEEVTNWTFSDQQRRLEINVGVAYGSDPREVMELLTKVALEHDEVMDEPLSRTIFIGFGDNSLDFQLRAWTDSDQWVVLRSDLTLAVHDALMEAGIEIPFPQRDIHLSLRDGKLLEDLSNDDK